VSDAERKVWVNGKLVAERDARISIYDSALMFGDMVFEMTRSFNKTQFKLRDHIERLYASMRMVRIEPPMAEAELERAALETVNANEPCFAADDEHRLMIDVTRGLLGIYDGRVDAPRGTNVIIADFPLRWTVAGMGRLFDTGINAVVPSQRAIPGTLLDPKIKSRSRLHYQMANIQVSQVAGEDNWALLLDPDGYVAEGTGDNFFIVTADGTIATPEPRNILRGVSRAYIFALAKGLGIPCVERDIEVYDVVNAREAFMTGTPFCLLPVTRIDGQAIGDGRPGATTRALLAAWSAAVGVDIPAQIKAWDATANGPASSAPSPYAFKRTR
jgi:branched-chain amino acid aminotransferase